MGINSSNFSQYIFFLYSFIHTTRQYKSRMAFRHGKIWNSRKDLKWISACIWQTLKESNVFLDRYFADLFNTFPWLKELYIMLNSWHSNPFAHSFEFVSIFSQLLFERICCAVSDTCLDSLCKLFDGP